MTHAVFKLVTTSLSVLSLSDLPLSPALVNDLPADCTDLGASSVLGARSCMRPHTPLGAEPAPTPHVDAMQTKMNPFTARVPRCSTRSCRLVGSFFLLVSRLTTQVILFPVSLSVLGALRFVLFEVPPPRDAAVSLSFP
jgi:hypothetical protein